MSKLLEVKNLSVDYITLNGSVRAVDDVSFSIGEEQSLGLAGESGCGKSTIAYSVADEQIGLGYGYLWYVLPEDEILGRCFLHTGNGVHMLAVFPDIKLVMVHRVDTTKQCSFNLQNLFQLWDIFFSARD